MFQGAFRPPPPVTPRSFRSAHQTCPDCRAGRHTAALRHTSRAARGYRSHHHTMVFAACRKTPVHNQASDLQHLVSLSRLHSGRRLSCSSPGHRWVDWSSHKNARGKAAHTLLPRRTTAARKRLVRPCSSSRPAPARIPVDSAPSAPASTPRQSCCRMHRRRHRRHGRTEGHRETDAALNRGSPPG